MKYFQIPSLYSEIENEGLIIKFIKKYARLATEVILDDVDYRNFLKISRCTSLKYRGKGFFKFYKLDHKAFYILTEVIAGIKEYGGKSDECDHPFPVSIDQKGH